MGKIIKFLIFIAIAAVAAWFGMKALSSSEWLMKRTCRELSRAADLDMTAGSVKFNRCGSKVISDVKACLPGTDIEVFSATEIILPSFFCGNAFVRRPSFTVVQGQAGEWQPAPLQSASKALENGFCPVEFFTRLSAELPFKGDFTVSMATVSCRDENGSILSVFGGLSWTRGSVIFNDDREFTWHDVRYQTRDEEPAGPGGIVKLLWLERPGMKPAVICGGPDSGTCSDLKICKAPDAGGANDDIIVDGDNGEKPESGDEKKDESDNEDDK